MWRCRFLGFTAFDLGLRFWHARPLVGDGLSSGLSKVSFRRQGDVDHLLLLVEVFVELRFGDGLR